MKDILIITLSIVMTIYVILKNRKILKELTKLQLSGVGFSFLVAIFIAFICIYYGGNWIAGYSTNMIVRYIIQLIVVCLTLYLCGSILSKVLQKITKGVLPKN